MGEAHRTVWADGTRVNHGASLNMTAVQNNPQDPVTQLRLVKSRGIKFSEEYSAWMMKTPERSCVWKMEDQHSCVTTQSLIHSHHFYILSVDSSVVLISLPFKIPLFGGRTYHLKTYASFIKLLTRERKKLYQMFSLNYTTNYVDST